MIREDRGNLLTADADALVNTVNTVGVMGKGIALQFKQAYPANFRAYEAACRRGEVTPGRMFAWESGQMGSPRFIVNFPTKRHWRQGSRIEDIRDGLRDLAKFIVDHGVTSIAIPPLGCGNGGLRWDDVRPMIVAALEHVDAEIVLYPPAGAPAAEDMPVRSPKPAMTCGRAALLVLMKHYRESDSFRLSALEVQKLAYFLQASGEPLRLGYSAAKYGPYAENLNHVLIRIEGHYVRGYGDRSTEPRIQVLDDAYAEAAAFLDACPDTRDRLREVTALIDGWETPYGLELLATAHWAMTQAEPRPQSPEEVCSFVAAWTPRKAQLFKSAQVGRAIDQLVSHRFAPEVVGAAS